MNQNYAGEKILGFLEAGYTYTQAAKEIGIAPATARVNMCSLIYAADKSLYREGCAGSTAYSPEPSVAWIKSNIGRIREALNQKHQRNAKLDSKTKREKESIRYLQKKGYTIMDSNGDVMAS